MQYLETRCTLAAGATADAEDIVVALLAELGYESFETSENAVKAYIRKDIYDAGAVAAMPATYPAWIASIGTAEVKQENWNHVWESDFSMTVIADRCVIYAPFHTDIPDLPYKICILPQMSFGTGHHETTSLMIELLIEMEIKGKDVLDLGCGTGILAILASMMKAQSVCAVDIDEWAYRSTLENCERNGATHINVLQGGRSVVQGMSFDLILANINRNVLLEDIPACAACLKDGGCLQVSGFYRDDLSAITAEAEKNGLTFLSYAVKKDWTAAQYVKNRC
ncbi:MAG: 50S ribosomal protein L11 methyltransferase [Bacteroidales bacterium]|jgi:ribosomal protein L11 methyltransferase|nr:50S ribosomal protein L11 methyltransferase [Bacteroidales bacterium]